MNKKIFPLALGGLAIGTTEFVIMGLLPDVATDMNISIPKAGYLISAYALGVVIGAPLLVALSGKYEHKKVLTALMLIFALFNGLSALAPEYYSLLLLRFLSGLPHGAFFGIGSVVATKLATEGKKAQYISMMFTGLTVANLAMVPLLTFAGHQTSWRYAFAIVGLLGIATLIAIRKLLPVTINSNNTLKQEMEFFASSKSWLIMLITAIGFGGLFAWFSYIAPLMIHVTLLPEKMVSYIMLLAGAGMVAGNIVGGYLADKMQPEKAAALLFILLVFSLIAVFFLSGNLYLSLGLTFICGALSMAVGSPVNYLMIRSAKNSETMAAAFMQAAFNIANSVGAFLGGIPLKMGLGFQYPAIVGAGMAFAGCLLCLLFIKRYSAPAEKKLESITVGNI
ncbi:MAG: MFS transporter [Ferruginibacter sp.]